MPVIDFPYRCRSVVFSIHIFGEVVCPLPVAGVEGEIDLSRGRENVAQFVALPKKISVCQGVILE